MRTVSSLGWRVESGKSSLINLPLEEKLAHGKCSVNTLNEWMNEWMNLLIKRELEVTLEDVFAKPGK